MSTVKKPMTDPWRDRVETGDWDAITADVNEYGGAQLPQLLTADETARIRELYGRDDLFRSIINMGRHRFGEGQYRYFNTPYPGPVERLKRALYPRLLPIARDWWTKLGRPVPWPDTLDEWLRMCHDAGQTKSSAILLRYAEKDWNALHRDLYGDLVFPAQVVINLNDPGVDHTGGEFLLVEQRPRAQSRGTATLLPHGHGYVFTTRDRPVASRSSGPANGTPSPSSSMTLHKATAAAGLWLRGALCNDSRRNSEPRAERRIMEAVTSPLLRAPAHCDADLPVTNAELAGIVELARSRDARTIAIGSGRGACSITNAHAIGTAWERAGGRALETITWPETGASWLRHATRFAAADPDLWVMTGPGTGWAQMTSRLLWSTGWDPARTIVTAGIGDPGTLALVGLCNLEGIAGADTDGTTWLVTSGSVSRRAIAGEGQ